MNRKRWWRFWKTEEERGEDMYHRGFDWAAGRLLRGISAEELACNTDSAKLSDSYSEFERGIDDAIRAFQKVRVGYTPDHTLHIWRSLVATEYREQDRAYRFPQDCGMGRNARSQLHLVHQLAYTSSIPMAYLFGQRA